MVFMSTTMDNLGSNLPIKCCFQAKLLKFFGIALFSLAVFTPATFAALSDGDDVRSTTDDLSIRSSPMISEYNWIDEADEGDTGTIIDGPTSANGYRWWRINWDGPQTGWSVENYLEEIVVLPEPDIDSVSPDPVPPSNSSQTVTIRGDDFQYGCTLIFRDTDGTEYPSQSSKLTFNSDSKLTYQLNNWSDVGTWRVKVINPDGQDSSWEYFDVAYESLPPPDIDSISPDPVPASNSSQPITIRGDDFQENCTLTFRDTDGNEYFDASKFTYNSDSRLTYQLNNWNDVGTWRVEVTNPDGQDSGWYSFDVEAAALPAPTISSMSPDPMTAINANQTVTINGVNFQSGCTVTFTDTDGYTYFDASKLTYNSSSRLTYQLNNGSDAGTWYVKVNNPDGKSSANYSFTVEAGELPTPSISSVSPNPMTAMSANQTVTINGANFQSGCTVTFTDTDGITYFDASKFTYNSSSKLTYELNNGSDVGTWTVRVNNPDGKNSGNYSFTVEAGELPTPSISSVSPDPMTAMSVNQTVTINGANFQSGCTVTFTDTEGYAYFDPDKLTYNSSSKLTYQLNNGSDVGTWTVRVNNPDGKASANYSFTVEVAELPAPTIGSVSPNPVFASYDYQTITISGANFQPDCWLRFTDSDGTPYDSKASRLNYNTSTKLTYEMNNNNDAGAWTVMVLNSDEKFSSPYSFAVQNVPRPNLIVDQVTFSPSSVLSGGDVSVSFRIRNIGVGDAIATKARVRLSMDTSLTSSDIPMSPVDVSIPAISAGSSYIYSGSLSVPGSTPQGAYYIGVFADADNRANQSDKTDDEGLSATRIAVENSGVYSPTVTINPAIQTVVAGGTMSFSAEVSIPGDYSYQWLFNGNLMSGDTGQTITSRVTPESSGSYQVIVGNSADSVISVPATLIVDPYTDPEPTDDHQQVELILKGAFDPNCPTIVVTHGWQGFDSYSPNNAPDWLFTMVNEIKDRLDREQYPPVSLWHRANIYYVHWSGAYTPVWNHKTAFGYVDDAGKTLAALLEKDLGDEYSKEIHFIGHSFGTFVNAWAVSGISSRYEKMQFTILDAPIEKYPAQKSIFDKLLLPSQVKWVDNYYGDDRDGVYGALGEKIKATAADGGWEVPGNHTNVHNEYLKTITDDERTDYGFHYSIVLGSAGGYAGRASPEDWSQSTYHESVLHGIDEDKIGPTLAGVRSADYQSGFRQLKGTVEEGIQNVNGQVRKTLSLIKTDALPSKRSISATSSGVTSAAEPESAMAVDVAIPMSASSLEFEYKLTTSGTGDWINVLFNDEQLFYFRAVSFIGTNFSTAILPISEFAGQCGILKFQLNGGGSADTTLTLSKFEFKGAPVYVYKINSGGETESDDWQADSGWSGTAVDSSIESSAIVNAGDVPQAVYQSRRWGSALGYELDVPDGTYNVRLHFAELYWNEVNQRRFDVSIEGQPVLSNFDIWSAAGGVNRAVTRTFEDVVVSNGLSIHAVASRGEAQFNGIEVWEALPPPPNVIVNLSEISVPEGSNVTFGVELSDAPEGTVTVSVVRMSGDGSIAVSVGEALTFTASNYETAQPVTLSAEADEDADNGMAVIGCHALGYQSAEVSVTEQDIDVPEVYEKINCGSTAVEDWAADRDYTTVSGGANTYWYAILNAGDVPEAVYKTRRYGQTVSYNLDIPDGLYNVRLHFAELYSATIGLRRFNVSAEGQPVLSNFDICLEAGGMNKALVKTFENVNVSGGLQIQAVSISGTAQFNGIEVWSAGPPAPAVEVDSSSLSVAEGGSATFGVNLSQAPAGPLTVQVAQISGDTDLSVTDGAALEFDADNYAIKQMVTVSALEDTDSDAGVATIQCTAEGFVQAEVLVTEMDNDAPPLCKKINCGSTTVEDWETDRDYTTVSGGANTYWYAILNAGDVPEAVYKTRRYGQTVIYDLDIPDGIYAVRLHFAELYSATIGLRRFNVSIEGAPVLSNFDICLEAGGMNKALVKTFENVTVSAGLQIQAVSISGTAQFNGIEVWEVPFTGTEITACSFDLSQGRLDLSFTGGTSGQYMVWWTTNLLNWPTSQIVNLSSNQVWVDTNNSLSLKKFYRLSE
jgi:Malectin domain/CARDB